MKPITPARPYVTYALIAVMVIIQAELSLLSPAAQSAILEDYALTPANVAQGRGLSGLTTYLFLERDWVRLLVDSFAVFIVGSVVEARIGHSLFGLVFLVSGWATGLVHVILNQSSGVQVTGAVGGLFGVLSVMFLLMPFDITDILSVPLQSVLVGLLALSVEVATLVWSRDPFAARYSPLVGLGVGLVAAFRIDGPKALKGLVIMAGISLALYFLFVYLQLPLR